MMEGRTVVSPTQQDHFAKAEPCHPYQGNDRPTLNSLAIPPRKEDLIDFVRSLRSFNPNQRNRNKTLIQFPVKLHVVLDAIEQDGFADIISWHQNGQCFTVHKPPLFDKIILPKYFPGLKRKSFSRHLSLYGFRRLPKSAGAGTAYYHEFFRRYDRHLLRQIIRRKPSGKAVSQSEDETCSYGSTSPSIASQPPLKPDMYSLKLISSAPTLLELSPSPIEVGLKSSKNEGIPLISSPMQPLLTSSNPDISGPVEIGTATATSVPQPLPCFAGVSQVQQPDSLGSVNHLKIDPDGFRHEVKPRWADQQSSLTFGQNWSIMTSKTESLTSAAELDSLAELFLLTELDNCEFDQLFDSLIRGEKNGPHH
jgi:HSF-type DNA-binding